MPTASLVRLVADALPLALGRPVLRPGQLAQRLEEGIPEAGIFGDADAFDDGVDFLHMLKDVERGDKVKGPPNDRRSAGRIMPEVNCE